jgi:hypothetical protein
MRNLIAIVAAAAIGAAVSVTVTRSAHTPDAERAESVMPSIAQIMSDARSLPMTPLVSP